MSALPTLAQEDHVCASCGLTYHDVTVEEIPDRLRAEAARIRDVAERLTPHALTHRPDERTWSALEYLCHVRDVFVASTIRLYRARKETQPQIEPVFNDLRVVRFRYNEADLRGVLHEMDAALLGLIDEMARVADWDRTFSRQPGEERTVRWLVRQALHEAMHHAADMLAGARSA